MGSGWAGGELVGGWAEEAGGSWSPAGGDGQAAECHGAWDGDKDGTRR